MSLKSKLKEFIGLSIWKVMMRISARLTDPVRIALLRHRHVGSGSYIDPSVHVLGWRNTLIGRNSVLSENVCVNVNHRSGSGWAVVVGDNCFIGRRNFFSSGKAIVVKDYCMTGTDCRFNGADHIFSDPFRPYIDTGTTQQSSITIGVNCWLGANVTILGDVSIGHGSIIGAGSLVTKSAPAFSLLFGSPARVVKRFDTASAQWIPASEFTEAMGAALPNEAVYLEILQRSAPDVRIPKAAAGKAQGDLP